MVSDILRFVYFLMHLTTPRTGLQADDIYQSVDYTLKYNKSSH
jgi:hypothetical protein